jgi:hypothetical protein
MDTNRREYEETNRRSTQIQETGRGRKKWLAAQKTLNGKSVTANGKL